jgi:hypothetical protein
MMRNQADGANCASDLHPDQDTFTALHLAINIFN